MLLMGWLRLPSGEYGMTPLLLLLLGVPVLGVYLLYALVCYFLSRSIMPTGKMIKVVFIFSAALVMLVGLLDPLYIINLVFIAALFVASTVSWLLYTALSKMVME